MSGSRLAQHLPSLFGPSRRAAWRLSVLRRFLALAALLLAIQLSVAAAVPPAEPAQSPTSPRGATVVLPLAAPVDLPAGTEVSVYAAGRAGPVADRARLVAVVGSDTTGDPHVRVELAKGDVGPIVQELGASPRTTFVLVGRPAAG